MSGLPVQVDDGDVRGGDVREAGPEGGVVGHGADRDLAGVPGGGGMRCVRCGASGTEHFEESEGLSKVGSWELRVRWWRCGDCGLMWSATERGLESYSKEEGKFGQWFFVPPGTLPVFWEAKADRVCLSCGGALAMGERGTWKECRECGFGWGMTLAPAEWAFKRTDPDGVTRIRRLPDGFSLLVASWEEAS